MNALFIWLWLATLACFIVAVFKPTAFTRVTKRNHKRKHLLPFFIAVGTVLLVGVGATASPGTTYSASKAAPSPQIVTKTVTTTKPVAFQAQTINDNTLTQGQTTVKQNGVNGVDTTTYSVTYTNGQETSRKQVSDSVTTQPVPEIIDNGTYVAPAAPALSNNNTYVNSSGNTVHSPADSTNGQVPAGATAQCVDGTYSFSQHHQGTCSYHGGVSQWLY